jgi:uncharacterized protein with HEPN domain
MRDNRLYLIDILESVERIQSYTEGGIEVFAQTPIIQDAVIRNFAVIGEATKRLPTDFRQRYPDIPWQKVAGLRDVLIHDYLRIDINELWGIIEQNLPELKTAVTAILQELGEDP